MPALAISPFTAPLDELELLLRRPGDERAARAHLRRQIARLERELGALTLDLWEAGRSRLPPSGEPTGKPSARLLTVGDLEVIRDALVRHVGAAAQAVQERAALEHRSRAQLERMLADPPGHRFHVVERADLGEPSCGAYQVRPRLGLLGMLFGWWCVKLSSGCPLPMPHQRYYHRRERKPWGRHARLELAVTIIVSVAVIATLVVFLVVLHDIPFRPA